MPERFMDEYHTIRRHTNVLFTSITNSNGDKLKTPRFSVAMKSVHRRKSLSSWRLPHQPLCQRLCLPYQRNKQQLTGLKFLLIVVVDDDVTYRGTEGLR